MAQPTPDRPDINLWSLHPDAGVEDCVLVGGPKDGQEFGLRDPPNGLRFPVGREPEIYSFDSPCGATPPTLPVVKVLRYELEFHQGHPSRDDRGRLRYVYRGIVEL